MKHFHNYFFAILIYINKYVAKPLFSMHQWLVKNVLFRLAFIVRDKTYELHPLIIKTLSYKDIRVKVLIRTMLDFTRMRHYARYPVDVIYEEIQNASNEPIVYYEIGANVGYSVIIIAKLLRKRGVVYTFEVESSNYRTLTDNVRLNDLENVITLPIAVSNETCIKPFYYSERKKNSTSGKGVHSLQKDGNHHTDQYTSFVPVMTLDQIIKEFDLPLPTHVFIDVYNSELEILLGMETIFATESITTVMVQIEPHGVNFSKEEDFPVTKTRVYKLLCSYGFVLLAKLAPKIKKDLIIYNCIFRRQR